jgi:hypothetical protein
MRAAGRIRRTLVLLVLLTGAVGWSLPAPHAAAADVVLAQDPNTEEDVVGQEEEAEGQEGSGGGTAEESGADEGETEGAAEEAGPPWTYQMARLGILLVVVMILGVGFAYYRFVVRRQRGAV